VTDATLRRAPGSTGANIRARRSSEVFETLSDCVRNAALTVAALFALAAVAQPGTADLPARVDAYVTAEMARAHIPGMAVGIVKDGRVLLAKGYGLANVEHQVPVTRQTVFQSGSMGKQFTATAVMMLAADGKLSLDDTLDRFFTGVPESWKRITVRHLLSHTSGFGDYGESFDMRRDYTEDELLEFIKGSPLVFATGESWSYSNLGFVTLGILVHKVSGKFYGDFLRERIFQPLGMGTRVISEADIVPHRAAGYRIRGGELKNQGWVSPSMNTTADGSLYFSLDDLLNWETALEAGRPIGREGLQQMWTPAPLTGGRVAPYGYGWFTIRAAGRRIFFHGGAWQGFKTFIARFPDDRLTVILLANLWDTNEWRMTRAMASVFIPALGVGPDPIADAEPNVTALARKVLRQIAAGVPDASLFTPEAGAGLTPERVAALRARLEAVTLPPALIASIELIGRSEGAGLRTYRYALADVAAAEVFMLSLAADGRIAALDLAPTP
jgi:CubicO group peptidase (beta-lactamase class C family)